MSEQEKEFLQFFGDFREFRGEMNEFRRNTREDLDKIQKSLDTGNTAFEDIRKVCASHKGSIEVLEHRVNDLEEKDVLGGITKKEKVGLVASIVGTIYLLVRIAAKYFGVELP